jgi:hypothetical protein
MSNHRRIAVVVSLMVGAVVAATPAVADPGVFVLDGAGGANGRTSHGIGADTATAVFQGDVFVFSSDTTSSDLRVGRRSDRWRFRMLDGAGGVGGRIAANVGSDVAAATFGDALHAFYRDDTHGDLRHAWFDGTSWRFETLDGAGGADRRTNADVGTSISAQVFRGSLLVFYVDRSRTNIRRARLSSDRWAFSTLDGAGGARGRIAADVGYNTATAVFDGALHVFYFFQDPFCDPDFGCRLFGTVRHATRSPGTPWIFEDVTEMNCCFEDLSLAVATVSDTSVWLFYQNFGLHSENLRHVHWNGTAWVAETQNGFVEEAPGDGESVGDGASALMFDGRPYVFFHGAFNFQGLPDGVREAFWDGTSFVVSNIGIFEGRPTSSLVRGGRRLVFVGDATVPVDRFDGHDLAQARLR